MTQEYGQGDAYVLVDNDSGLMISNDPSATKIVRPIRNDLYQSSTDTIAFWGDNNDFPQCIDRALQKNTDLSFALDVSARALVSGGIMFQVVDPVTDEPIGVDKLDRKLIREIKLFRQKNWAYFMQASKDYFKYINLFPELSLTLNRKKIDRIYARPSGHCRLSLQDDNGLINECYVNANWPDAHHQDKETLVRPVVDSLFDMPEDLRERDSDGLQFIYLLSYPTGKTYYQLADWDGIRNNGWLDLANEIPQFKMAIMKNQITIKYHIQFPDYYWTWKFGNEFEEFSENKKRKLRKKEFDRINDILKGTENAGKTLATAFKTDQDGKDFPGVKINEIGNKLEGGIYLEDSTEATIKIFSALGFDSSMFGIAPGKNGINKSGSDKREAMNIYMSLLSPHTEILLKPFQFASEFNGWNDEFKEVKWFTKMPMLQTLDQVTPSSRETSIDPQNAA